MTPPLRILHLHSSFDRGVGALRSVQVINALSGGCDHAIVSAQAGAMAAADGIARGIRVDLAPDFPSLPGRPTPARLQRLARAMLGHDLVLTYGYGALNAALAHTVFAGQLPLPPLVHHENGGGAEPATRNWVRRIALGRAAALVVPSRRLEALAVASWHQPRSRVKRIPPGIRTSAYAARPRSDALPRVIKRTGELWLGAVANGGPGDDLARLVRAFAVLPEPWQLVVLGEGSHHGALRDEALRRDLGHRVHLPGVVAEPGKVLGLFDLFVPASDGSDVPVVLLEAMAAGLALVAADVGDVAATLAPENRRFVVAPGDEPALAAALAALAEAPALRRTVGAANRALARAEYDEAAMVAAHRRVYAAALGQAIP